MKLKIGEFGYNGDHVCLTVYDEDTGESHKSFARYIDSCQTAWLADAEAARLSLTKEAKAYIKGRNETKEGPLPKGDWDRARTIVNALTDESDRIFMHRLINKAHGQNE
jgi:hypothetical protein